MTLNKRSINTELDQQKEKDLDAIAAVGEALGSVARLKLLRHLQEKRTQTVSEMSKELNVTKSTLLHHLDVLEKAGIVRIVYKSSSHGMERLVIRNLQTINLRVYYNLQTEDGGQEKTFLQNMPVGNYAEYEGDMLCFATEDTHFFNVDNCYSSERFNAELIYTQEGIVTYNFSNAVAQKHSVTELSLSLEICSEAPFYDNNYMSDVTFWVNNVEVATYTSEGDYGDRPGKLSPAWWPRVNTQYGKLVTVAVKEDGVYINGILNHSQVTVKDLKLEEGNKLALKIGNKGTSEHVGGFNIFGKNFGDFPQDICLQLTYKN